MKLSDYVAKFLEGKRIKTAYVLTGGCVVHLIDSIAKRKKIQYIPVQHEQSGAMAADCSSRVENNVSAVIATSGPGATNLLTGVCCSYYDSIPVIIITGQVPTNQLKGKSKSRQIGFQETDVVSIYKSVTKYSKLITKSREIRYELEKSFHIATTGRPGPVLLDICDDIQRAEININKLRKFVPKKSITKSFKPKINKFFKIVNNSKRPILVLGSGVRNRNIKDKVKKFIEILGIPFLPTWGAMDLLPHNHKLYSGSFGVTSGRAGNFAVQNCDLIISLGSRLDSHEVGSNIKTFAREAKRIVVDIDNDEQLKYERMGYKIDILHTSDVGLFLNEIINASHKLQGNNYDIWLAKIKVWKKNYVSCDAKSINQKSFVNPYFFIDKLSFNSKPGDIIITDCGSNLIWTMQGFKVKKNQRLISAWNHSPMGYSVPASIGAAFSEPKKNIICIIGDGGFQINIQELATIRKHNLNIKIFLMNNHCHGIIQGTQENWLNSQFHASDPNYGKLPDPNFNKIVNGYDIEVVESKKHSEINSLIKNALKKKGPIFCNIHLQKKSQIYPKLLFGKPIEDSHPLLSRTEFNENMIIKPIS